MYLKKRNLSSREPRLLISATQYNRFFNEFDLLRQLHKLRKLVWNKCKYLLKLRKRQGPTSTSQNYNSPFFPTQFCKSLKCALDGDDQAKLKMAW